MKKKFGSSLRRYARSEAEQKEMGDKEEPVLPEESPSTEEIKEEIEKEEEAKFVSPKQKETEARKKKV